MSRGSAGIDRYEYAKSDEGREGDSKIGEGAGRGNEEVIPSRISEITCGSRATPIDTPMGRPLRTSGAISPKSAIPNKSALLALSRASSSFLRTVPV